MCRDIDRHRELWKGLGKIKEVEVVVEVEGLKSLKEVYK